MRRFWPAGVLFLLPVIVLWRAVLFGEAIGPFDQIRQMAPWNGPKPELPWDVLQADAVLQFYVWRDLVFEAWRSGQPPFWNPYELAGTPLLANSQSAALYPPHILAGVLHLPTALALTLLAWLHLFWAGLGTFHLARRLGANEVGGLLAGASFSLSAFMIAWTPLASVITTASWIPWVLSFCLAIAAGDGSRIRNGALLAICVAMMLLGGHLQFAAYGLLAGALTAVIACSWRADFRRSLLGTVLVGAAVGLGGLVASPQLLPVLKFSEHSHRKQAPTEEGYQGYVYGAIRPFELGGLVAPSFLGSQNETSPESEPFPTYWPALAHRGANFAETALAIGPLAFLGLVFFPWRRLRTPEAALAATGVVAILLACGAPLNRLLYFYVPGWAATGSPGRVAVIFVLAACVLAGVGYSKLAERQMPAGSLRTALRMAGLILAAYVIFAMLAIGWAQPWVPQMPQEVVAKLAQSALLGAFPSLVLVLLICTIGIQLLGRGSRHGRWLLVAAAAVTPPAMLGLSPVRTGEPLEAIEMDVEKSERIAVVNEPWHLLAAAPAVLPPNTAAILRIHELSGYDSLTAAETVAILNEINGRDSAPEANGNIMFVKPGFDPSKLADAGVTEVWSRSRIDGLGEPISGERGVFRYRLDGPGRAFTDLGPAEIVEEGFDRLVVRAQGPGTLTVRDRWMEGWEAAVDGKLASMPPGRWRQVQIPPGEHLVTMRYAPPGYTLWPAAFGLAVCGASLVFARRGRPSESRGQEPREVVA